MVEAHAAVALVILVLLPVVPLYLTSRHSRKQRRVNATYTTLRIALRRPAMGVPFGVEFASDKEQTMTRVAKLSQRGLLAEAGVMIDDRVTVIGDVAVTCASAAVQSLVDVPEGQDVVLFLERKLDVDLEARLKSFRVRVRRPSPVHPLGVRLHSEEQSRSAMLSSTGAANRVFVEAVDEDSLLGRAGLLPGDVLLHVNGARPLGAKSATELLRDCPADVVELTVQRPEEIELHPPRHLGLAPARAELDEASAATGESSPLTI